MCVKERGPTPLVTWVNDLGRIELSAATFANAVSKASNFLVDGLELDEGAAVNVALGNHWQSAVWLGTALTVGLTITDQAPALTFGVKSQAQTWQGSTEEFVVISQDPFGMPDKDIPSPSWEVSSEHPAIQVQSTGMTWTQLVARSLEIAQENHIQSGQSYGIYGISDIVTMAALQIVFPVTNGNSVVLIDQSNPDFGNIKKQEKLDRIVELG
ncbi:MAG: hypothetical protein EBU96_06785 [Actinobacteria bacterium]|nr:hypothetical protein [Actinomycetota bacterium]